jgi:hypothetical protein
MYYRPVKQTTDTTTRINITDFRRNGFLQPGRTVEGTGTIHGVTITARSESTQTLILKYTWQGVNITQQIDIIRKPSNLAGELLFFTCPGTAKPCRIIYQTIGNLYGFYSYDYLRKSLYYETQRHTKTYKATGKLFTYEAIIDRLTAVRDQTHYNGKETKRTAQLKQWANRYNKANKQAWDDLFTAFQQP